KRANRSQIEAGKMPALPGSNPGQKSESLSDRSRQDAGAPGIEPRSKERSRDRSELESRIR
ncbi:MAG: hypothetical protein K2X77_29610, partial [Candidatus Obscuribacterales bacterium]|nr:hypothetical protein [Candidatus Obscuribacterales bacterium]